MLTTKLIISKKFVFHRGFRRGVTPYKPTLPSAAFQLVFATISLSPPFSAGVY
jgi:hypothetical protein